MKLYRISNCNHAKDLSGTGARLFGGRWNSIGVSMHYMAENRSLAALEVLANKNHISDSNNLCLTLFELPENSIDLCDIQQLPDYWRAYPAPLLLKKIGDEFIRKNDFLLLRVPSSIIEDEYNYLMNVTHPLAKEIKIIAVKPFSFDARL